jgi:FkbM family methyltransferase
MSTLPVDRAPYGTQAPDRLVAAVLAFTRSLPANWLGFRVSTPFRRLAIDRLGERPVDTVVWGVRMRLYPQHNSCEKNALFTPQIFDALERRVLAAAIDQRIATGGDFTFVDLGANVGLYSLFAASRGPGVRVIALEPQPGLVDRFAFNAQVNPQCNIELLKVAVIDREAEVELAVHHRDRAGGYVRKGTRTDGDEVVRVPGRPLLAILAAAGVAAVDALKIDIEGAEDLALAPFLREAPRELLPRLLLIEDRPDWDVDLYALLEARGYAKSARSRHNIIFRLA